MMTMSDKSNVAAPLQDAYLVADLDLPFTRKVPTLGSTLDHIFVTTDFDVPVVYNPLLLRSTQEEQLNKCVGQCSSVAHMGSG